MSYKLKSLIYFSAFVASAFLYNSMITEDPKKPVTASAELQNAVTHTEDMGAQEEVVFPKESIHKQ